jgi:hypothetical protein
MPKTSHSTTQANVLTRTHPYNTLLTHTRRPLMLHAFMPSCAHIGSVLLARSFPHALVHGTTSPHARYGMLLHFLPSMWVRVPVALGSAGTHRALGGVWAVLVLISYCMLTFVFRGMVVAVGVDTDSGGTGGRAKRKTVTFAVPNRARGAQIVALLATSCPGAAELGAAALASTTGTPLRSSGALPLKWSLWECVYRLI